MITLQDGTQHELQEGDVFYWSYKKEIGDLSLLYWCKSRKAIVIDGEVRDLFWSQGKGSESYVLDMDKIDLVFKGNIHHYTEIHKYNMKFYADEDLLDISHANYSDNWGGVYYLRNGATRSRQKILDLLANKREAAEHKISEANRELVNVSDYLHKIQDDNFNLDDVYI